MIAIGSNRRGRHGPPISEVAAAIDSLAAIGRVVSVAPVVSSAAIGPSQRRYANTAVLVETTLAPPAMLVAMKAIERRFGRRAGRRWGSRVIDLDLALWSGGRWAGRGLTIPHPAFRDRAFVLGPMAAIVPRWRDPLSGLTVRHLRHRLAKVDRTPRAT